MSDYAENVHEQLDQLAQQHRMLTSKYEDAERKIQELLNHLDGASDAALQFKKERDEALEQLKTKVLRIESVNGESVGDILLERAELLVKVAELEKQNRMLLEANRQIKKREAGIAKERDKARNEAEHFKTLLCNKNPIALELNAERAKSVKLAEALKQTGLPGTAAMAANVVGASSIEPSDCVKHDLATAEHAIECAKNAMINDDLTAAWEHLRNYSPKTWNPNWSPDNSSHRR